ncbi:bifunctional diaminohydroxyphosphoribosylaminopyrimidine deaminase/5-amino-6-(5-phosphoribosylamino)uracil reductase RibD [soil metagenome]
MTQHEDRTLLDLAARAASRSFGLAAPHHLVGTVLTRPGPEPALQRVLAIGHHRRFGGPHAEPDAFNAARTARRDVRGATMHVTLEPCNHTGKQPPCVDAIIAAGIARVVIAQRDPNPIAAGGAVRLRAAGVAVEFSSASTNALALSAPFLHRLATPLPWVIAKWAQTIDGRIATAAGDSQWISGPRARRRVHRLRAGVDAIITGTGTLIADDPRLTARDVPLRKAALRVLVDRDLKGCKAHLAAPRKLFAEAGTMVFASRAAIDTDAELVAQMTRAGARIVCGSQMDTPLLPGESPDDPWTDHSLAREYLRGMLPGGSPDPSSQVCLRTILFLLRTQFNVSTAMLEAGPRLVSAFLWQRLVNECLIFVAPLLIGDAAPPGPARGSRWPSLAAVRRWNLIDHRRIGDDIQLRYTL